MKVGIMQPYFLPYVGYFQLMQYCDVFVIYDDIKYTKKGWINRNRMLVDGSAKMFTLPLQHDSDYLDVRDRTIAPIFNPEKMMNQFAQSYRRAPHWKESSELIQRILCYPSRNLFEFNANSLTELAEYLNITTSVIVSSELGLDRGLRGQDRVIATCEVLNATDYVNPIGGLELYQTTKFRCHGINLTFLRTEFPRYDQLQSHFVKDLSIIDVLMFVDRKRLLSGLLTAFQIVDG